MHDRVFITSPVEENQFDSASAQTTWYMIIIRTDVISVTNSLTARTCREDIEMGGDFREISDILHQYQKCVPADRIHGQFLRLGSFPTVTMHFL
jgi:hypothetical protein